MSSANTSADSSSGGGPSLSAPSSTLAAQDFGVVGEVDTEPYSTATIPASSWLDNRALRSSLTPIVAKVDS
ncbi:hypothetical protein ON010_g7835 [Phytophthora cinnamomi]|nr:hypothetical protein ON010_g7835 [Phytophthora cinnamomi]